MNAGRAAITAGHFTPFLQCKVVISLPATSEGVGIVRLSGKQGVFLDGSTPPRTHDSGKLVGVNPDLVMSVSIQVQDLRRQHLIPAQIAFGLGQITPDTRPKVGKVEAAEDA